MKEITPYPKLPDPLLEKKIERGININAIMMCGFVALGSTVAVLLSSARLVVMIRDEAELKGTDIAYLAFFLIVAVIFWIQTRNAWRSNKSLKATSL
jgi:hypothetical protein